MTSRPDHPRLLLCAAAMAALGCEPDLPTPEPGTWMLTPQPRLSIGDPAGTGPDGFREITAAAVMADGRIAVGEHADRSLRVFTSDGDHAWTLGGRGAAADRLRIVQAVFPYRGDSIAVVDVARVVIVDRDGRVGRTVPMSAPLAARPGWQPLSRGAGIVAAFDDGSFLAEGWTHVSLEGQGVRRGQMAMLHVSAEGQTLDTIGRFPHRVAQVDAGRYRTSDMPAPLAYAVVGDQLVVGGGDEPALEVRTPAGAVEDTIRLDERPVTLDRNAQTDFYRRLAVFLGVEDDPDLLTPEEMAGVFPEQAPLFHALHVDTEGNLWLATPSLDLPGREERWVVYTRGGDRLAEIVLPARARVAGFLEDEIVLIEMNEQDFALVRSYGILKP